jgi:hypothetical protein
VKHLRKSNIAWLPYGAKVVKIYFYFHLKNLFLLYEMKKGFPGDEKRGTGNRKRPKNSYLRQKTQTGPLRPSPRWTATVFRLAENLVKSPFSL